MNRRNFIAFAPAVAVVAAAPAVAMAAAGPDHVIEAAWKARQTAFFAYGKLVTNGDTPEEKALWNKIDAAEEVIRSSVAKTPRGVSIQLWTALYHDIITREEEEAINAGNFEALEAQDSNLDWSARLVLAALRSLRQMENV